MRQLNADEADNAIHIALYDRYASTIFAYLYRQVASREDAEDLLLEVFLAAISLDAAMEVPAIMHGTF